MILKKTTCLLALLSICLGGYADIVVTATYTDKEGTEQTVEKEIQDVSAPLRVHFTTNALDLYEGASLEWRIRHQSSGPRVTRYDQELDYTFTEAGINLVTLRVMQEGEAVDSTSFSVTISESCLEMPNAFSPNGDEHNNIYRPKQSSLKSIVEFHAYIFNRHGQKLFDWTDPTKGWDGTYRGNPVKDGVYFVYVKARGADGIEYNIRRDVNLIRNFNTVTNTSQP